MKVVTRQKVIEERVIEYEPGDIVCIDCNEIRRKWVIIVGEKDSQGRYDAIPIECPTNKVGFNTWRIRADEVCLDWDVLHVPVKDVSDVTVTEKEELEQ
jgi:hypothetical protein